MEKFYGLVFDVSKNCFRDDSIEGMDGIVGIAKYLAELTVNDEEPYTDTIDTVNKALEFLDLWEYDIVPVNQNNYILFNKLVAKNTASNNRLSYDLEKEFYQRAEDYHYRPLRRAISA